MKQKDFLKIAFLLLFTIPILNAQSAGDIAFVGFNADGDKDFAIVTLADISAGSTIYFTDDETTGVGSPSALAGSEGTITWNTGSNIIKAGTVVVFTDLDNSANTSFGVSIGSITRSGSFNPGASKDGIIAFLGTDSSTPTTYIAAIQIGNDNIHLGPFDGDGITLTNTGLVIGTSIIVVDNSASPDGGYYSGSRSSETSYSDYYSEIETNGNWTTHGSDGESLLPFSQEAFTINTTTWTGGNSSVWNLAGNWDNGIPTEDSNVIIPDTANDPIITSTLNAGNITLNANANLTISGSITNKGLTTINSGATIIATGTLSGVVTYNRNLANGSQWYNISSPVVNESFDDTWVTNNSIASGQNNNRGVSWYDNTSYDTDIDGAGSDTETANWRYLQAGNNGTFNTAQGYSIIRTGFGNVSFSGTGIYTSTQTFGITQGASNSYNLVGNPFTAYLNLGDFLTDNPVTTVLTASEAYFWNGTDYDTRTSALHSSYEIAPGQGFFVEAAANTNITFDIDDVSHQGTDTFQKSSRPEIHLLVSDGSTSRYANVYYIDGTTTGFDTGYDGKLFGGVSQSFALYTHLVSGNQGVNYQLQSLPNSDHENMVIPVGLKANKGKEIIFSTETLNLPSGIKVFLEDRQTNTFTRLDEVNSNYKVTLTEKSEGIGRFYLHSKSNVLKTNDINLKSISIYKTDNTTLKIVGLSQGKANVKLFNILGKQMMHTSFTSKGVSELTLPKLATGVYIVQLETEAGKLNKKIILE